ncbi:YheC/YheD family protein [Paenibacillus xylanilyticus]|uniref:YheC/YheD family protein n=1 Tax=Paenibacillus xylanilyticus TaxID=248903 RepID=A0A7Y6EUE1_9BACL|nr:YheC/YheD family protein [Paenibacillus xylanilyticus]NUU74290.1 YheC/YheD family protein [Paenibacillus xylanilyticus]
MSIQRVSSKWTKTVVLQRSRTVNEYIPVTRQYNRQTLERMTELFELNYIKPDHGTYGNGVMRVKTIHTFSPSSPGSDTEEKGTEDIDHLLSASSLPESSNQDSGISSIGVTSYQLQYGTKQELYPSLDELHKALEGRIQGHTYLIQQGIPLLKHEGLPFDLRVLTQKNLKNNWETTGILGRIAAPGKIITNIHGGGRLATFEELVMPHLHTSRFQKLRSELYRLGIHTAVQLQKSFPRLKEIGIDIALDETGRPWILEVNTLPGIYAFGLLPDKEAYRKIKRYAIAYGRLPSKKKKPARHTTKSQASSSTAKSRAR